MLTNKNIKLSIKQVAEVWERTFPEETVPSKSTINYYFKNRLGLNYKKRRTEPFKRQGEQEKKHRVMFYAQLYKDLAAKKMIIWYDQKGFQTLDSQDHEWNFP